MSSMTIYRKFRTIGAYGGAMLGMVTGVIAVGPALPAWSPVEILALLAASAALGAALGWLSVYLFGGVGGGAEGDAEALAKADGEGNDSE